MARFCGANTRLPQAVVTVLLQLHLLIVFSITAASGSQLQLKEQVDNACRASFPSGSVDLSPLDRVSRTGDPRFVQFAQVIIGGFGYNLTYNPCSGFACHLDTAAAICAKPIFPYGLTYDIASQVLGKISQVNGTLQVSYASSGQTLSFRTVVTLVCSPSSDEDQLTGVQMSGANVLTFQLVSKHSCLAAPPTIAGGWSPGDYMVLAFFLALFLYLVCFLAINGLIRKRRGLDLLPHRQAWIYVGLLIKDGCVFTFGKIRQKIVASRGNYTEI